MQEKIKSIAGNFEGYSLEIVKSFTYLGAKLHSKNKIEKVVNKMIVISNKAFLNITFYLRPNGE